jgi:hypothetical protein
MPGHICVAQELCHQSKDLIRRWDCLVRLFCISAHQASKILPWLSSYAERESATYHLILQLPQSFQKALSLGRDKEWDTATAAYMHDMLWYH